MLPCLVAAHEDDNTEIGRGVEAAYRTGLGILCAAGAQAWRARERAGACVSCKCKSPSTATATRRASAWCARRHARARGSTTGHGESIYGGG